jgi:hypothetical protein
MTDYHFPTEIESFIKALVDSDRLRIAASLSQKSNSPDVLAAELNIKYPKLLKHLTILENANLVSKNEVAGDLAYAFNQKHLEKIARQVFASSEKGLDLSSLDLDQKQKKIIYNYFFSDGTLKMMPTQRRKIVAVCLYIIDAFKFQVDYSEKEVNQILSRFHQDTTTLRRYLVETELLSRESDGSRYWRIETETSL